MSSPLYLRDLKPSLKQDMENSIRKNRPDLVAAMENGDDIEIGTVFNKAQDYQIA